MSREAMQQALEALVTCCAEEWRTLNNFGMKQVYDEKKVNAAIAALHAALAEPEQKPSGSFVLWENTLCNPLADPRSMAHSAWHDGYASAKAERKPLTDEEIAQAMFRAHAIVTGPTQFRFAKEIERAHGIGEQHEH